MQSWPMSNFLKHESVLFSDERIQVNPPNLDDIKKLIDAAKPIKRDNVIEVISNAGLWNHSRCGLKKSVLSSEQKKKYKKMKDKASALLKEIETCHLDSDFQDVSDNKRFINDKCVSDVTESAMIFINECQRAILNKSKRDPFPDFIFETAVLFEYLTGEQFTSTNATPNLETKGEKFAAVASGIIAELILIDEKITAASYNEAFPEDDWGDIKLEKIPSHRIKTACGLARDRLRSYGGKVA